MSSAEIKNKQHAIGTIEWRDLSVDNADEGSNFYTDVVGWRRERTSMGDYDDFNIQLPDSGETIAGVCHARGPNASLPPQWLMYVRVANSTVSAEKAKSLGGKIIKGPTKMGDETYFVIEDPAGAVLAVFS